MLYRVFSKGSQRCLLRLCMLKKQQLNASPKLYIHTPNIISLQLKVMHG